MLALGLLVPILAQQPSQPEDDEEVVRITTNLVQVDAVVLDKDGHHVTDLRKGPLSLSGVVLAGVDPARDATATAAEQLTGGEGVGAEAADTGLSPSVRRLRHGVFLDYGYAIYNAQLDKATGQPRLTTQVRLFRDGKPVFAGGVTPLDAGRRT
jgi:hypothetical protein